MMQNQQGPQGSDHTADIVQLPHANDNVPGSKPGERWECYCGRTRANPYGRPYLDDVGRIQGCDSCGDIVLEEIAPDRAALMRHIIASDLL
jgi:hypothetical protein